MKSLFAICASVIAVTGIVHAAAPDPALIQTRTATLGRASDLQLVTVAIDPSLMGYASDPLFFGPGVRNAIDIPTTVADTYTALIIFLSFNQEQTELIRSQGTVFNGNDTIVFDWPDGVMVENGDFEVTTFDIP